MRAFIAIPIDKSTRAKISNSVCQLKKMSWANDIRWFPEKNYHITLHFLGGKISPEKIQQVINSMDDWFSEGMSFFETEILGIKLFPNSKNPHTIVANLDSTIMMQYLIREIEDHLKPIGLQRAKQSFKPHISLGRIKPQAEQSNIEIPAEMTQLKNLWLDVDTINLYESKLTDSFPNYRCLKSIQLERY